MLGSLKRKVAPDDSDSCDDSDLVSLYTEGLSSVKRAAGDPWVLELPLLCPFFSIIVL